MNGKKKEDRWLGNSKLALVCFGIFFLFWAGQAVAGWRSYNSEQRQHGEPTSGFAGYLATGHFVEATTENWESEFLQMGSMVVLTAFLIQRGSAESKQREQDPRDEDPRAHRNDPDAPWPVRRGGLWLRLYENSLLAVFVLLFLASIALHAWSGAKEFSNEEQAHGGQPVTVAKFVTTGEFWFQSFQNWQSEFLAVGAIVVLTVFLRQRGSAESKPVYSPTAQTGES